MRKSLLKKIASFIKTALKEKRIKLILIHGAGAAGHQLAQKYGLQKGTKGNEKKLQGAFLSRFANQKLNVAVAEALYQGGLKVASIHTASAIVQKNGKITNCNLKIIKDALNEEIIPLLYGEMVFDDNLGMSICSGDAIVSFLAKKLNAKKVFFASDTDGIFNKDPHIYKNAFLIKKLVIKDIKNKIKLADSHNVDVTGGMRGKIANIEDLMKKSVNSVKIFNGLNAENYKKAISNEEFPHTEIQK